MVKELKQLEFEPMPGKKDVTAVDPDKIFVDEKKTKLLML